MKNILVIFIHIQNIFKKLKYYIFFYLEVKNVESQKLITGSLIGIYLFFIVIYLFIYLQIVHEWNWFEI